MSLATAPGGAAWHGGAEYGSAGCGKAWHGLGSTESGRRRCLPLSLCKTQGASTGRPAQDGTCVAEEQLPVPRKSTNRGDCSPSKALTIAPDLCIIAISPPTRRDMKNL